MSANVEKKEESSKIEVRKTTDLDILVQILEISFIFLLIFSLIALFETVLSEINFYDPIANNWLGEDGVGSLDGGNYQRIVEITLIFNLLLFTFSLLFGLWMRKTRDNWEWSQMGYTLSTPGFSFNNLLRRGFILGLIGIIIHFTAVAIISGLTSDLPIAQTMVFSQPDGSIYTPRQLNSEYYFGIVEMGFIWPLSAGFFFFAYAHTSLDSKLPTGIANILSTSFYVFYLQFFFLIEGPLKVSTYLNMLLNPLSDGIGFWIMSTALWIILYINFSAFAETKSIVLPFLMNFVYNVGITLIMAGNALLFTGFNNLMWLPYFTLIVISIIWYYFYKTDYSTIKIGVSKLRDIMDVDMKQLIVYVFLFVFLSFLLPGVINELLAGSSNPPWLIPLLYAINFIILIVLAIIVLTYEPTDVFDVLLIGPEGTPIASHIELFESNDVLISGFITALAAVDQEISKEEGGLTSIKRGQREILIEDGVLTRLVALADKDQSSIRQSIRNMHREFEIEHQKRLSQPNVRQFEEAKKFVSKLGELSITFNIPTQTRWISSISLAIAPLMISLIGLI